MIQSYRSQTHGEKLSGCMCRVASTMGLGMPVDLEHPTQAVSHMADACALLALHCCKRAVSTSDVGGGVEAIRLQAY